MNINLGNIGNIISRATQAASEVITSGSLDGVKDIIGKDTVGQLGDVFEGAGEALTKGRKVLKDVMDVATAGSFGCMLNTGLDKIGLPDVVGDVAGTVLDIATGNVVGASANGLDILEDVAKACGGDEIAGFLKAGANITGMFSSPASLGKIGTFIDAAGKTAEALDGCIDVHSKLSSGDFLGAAGSALGVLAQASPLGEAMGLDKAKMDRFNEVLDIGKKGLDFLQPALEDGRIDLADIQHLPIGDIAQRAGVPDKYHDALGVGAKFVGELAGGKSVEQALPGVAEGLIGIATSKGLLPDPELIKTAVDQGGALIQTAGDSPEIAQQARGWLAREGARQSDNFSLVNHHSQMLRM